MFKDASRQYEIELPDGSRGKLVFALGDLALDNPFTRHARSLRAVGFGVIGYILYKLGCEPAPLVLALVLSGARLAGWLGGDEPDEAVDAA